MLVAATSAWGNNKHDAEKIVVLNHMNFSPVCVPGRAFREAWIRVMNITFPRVAPRFFLQQAGVAPRPQGVVAHTWPFLSLQLPFRRWWWGAGKKIPPCRYRLGGTRAIGVNTPISARSPMLPQNEKPVYWCRSSQEGKCENR